MTAGKAPSAAGQEAGGGEPERLGSRRAAKPKPPARPLDPNLATQADLEALPGIGPVLAKRIIAYRTAHGPFKKIGDLEKVSGIGPKKLAKIKPFLIIKETDKTADERR
jgi:competence protein ComEA